MLQILLRASLLAAPSVQECCDLGQSDSFRSAIVQTRADAAPVIELSLA